MKWVLVCLILGILFVTGVWSAYWFLCLRGTRFDVVVEADGNNARFLVQPSLMSQINSISTFEVYSITRRENIWNIHHFDRAEFAIQYGEAPVHGRQRFPENEMPPRPLEEGEEILLTVNYQFDRCFAACGDTRFFSFIYSKGGNVIRCTELDRETAAMRK